MLEPAQVNDVNETLEEGVYKTLQWFFKRDINSFDKESLVDWVGKTLPPKALVRVADKDTGHKLIDIGGKQLTGLQRLNPTHYVICVAS